jgi:parallel beta-helix repeat protein
MSRQAGSSFFDVFGLRLFKANALTTSSQTIFEDKRRERIQEMRNRFFSISLVFTITMFALLGAAAVWGTRSTHARSILPQATTSPTPVTTCGEVLNQPGEYVLTTNLDCSGATGDYNGVTITASNVNFHLAGHTIASSDCDTNRNISGIAVAGGLTNVKIDGGAIIGFNDGIVLASSFSQVKGMTVQNACVFGIAVQGSNNVVQTNVVTGSGSDGIILSPATRANITSNYSSGNKRAGIAVSDFAYDNTIEKNVLNNNGGTGEGAGVIVFNGTKTMIRYNTANNNDFAGIRIASATNPRNEAGPLTTVMGNTVSGNANVGIWIQANAPLSSVSANTAFGNGDTDLLDEVYSCGTNTWLNNLFMTDLAGGVPDGGPKAGCIQ